MRNAFSLLFGLLLICLILTPEALAGRTIVQMQTNNGDITVELYNDQAPVTVENFLQYVNDDFYGGLIFHRVIEGFVIQAGAYLPEVYEFDFSTDDPCLPRIPEIFREPREPIELETDAELKNLRGTIAMARTSDPDSATSQFFINHEDNPSLNPGSGSQGYAVFGKVTEGMNVVDEIANVATFTEEDDPCRYIYFQDLPTEPVVLESVSVLREFEAGSADFTKTPFLQAADETVRSYEGQAEKEETSFQYEFNQITYLGVEALEWKKTTEADPDEIAGFTIVLAKDTTGTPWILKYILNEGTDNEVPLIDAEDLTDGVSFSEYAAKEMWFRLMAGRYNPEDLDDPCNMVVTGEGLNRVEEQIVSFTATAPNYEQGDLLQVKKTRGPAGSPTEIEWNYYHTSVGLVLTIVDDDGATDGSGWVLAPMQFDDTSNDFSDVPFLKIPSTEDTLTRTYNGKGSFAGSRFRQTFSHPDEPLLGLNYLKWQQSFTGSADVDNFTVNLAKDIDGTVWLMKYVLNGDTLFEAESILEVVPLSTIEDNMHFRLISGLYNPDEVNDPCNTFSVTTAGLTRTTTITGFNQTAPHIPVFTGELVKVVSYLESDPCRLEADTLYYHEAVGLVSDNREGEIGDDADGFELAFYGGIFDEDTSFDLSAVPFLHATDGVTRTFLGQGRFEGLSYTHTFVKDEMRNKMCLLWTQSKVEREEDEFPLVDKLEIYLARDSFENLWVVEFEVNGQRVYRAPNNFEARLLSTFDNFMPFRLMTGQYNTADPCAPINRVFVPDDDPNQSFVDKIVDFSVDFELPVYEDDMFAVRRTWDPCDVVADPCMPTRDWFIYDDSVGRVFNFRNTATHPDDPCYFDVEQPAPLDLGLDGFRLAYYGQVVPTFNADSDEFGDVPFAKARPGDFRIYRGQGTFAESSYRQHFGTERFLDVECLAWRETGVETHGKMPVEMLMARDSEDKLWLFRDERNEVMLFEPQVVDQAVPFTLYPDMRLRLMSDAFEEGTTVSAGPEEMQETERVVSLEEEIDLDTIDDDFTEDLVLVRWSVDPCEADIDWSYYHEDTGLVLDLWDDFYDPDLEDPCTFDPTIIETDGDGWYLADPCELEEMQIVLKAGRNRSRPGDSFVLQGHIPNIAGAGHEGLLLQVGPWETDIAADDPGLDVNTEAGLISYRGSPDGRSLVVVKMDLQREWLVVAAKNIDLTGIAEPIEVQVFTDAYLAGGTADLRPGQEIPIILQRGQKEALRSLKYRFVSDDGPRLNSLRLVGEIATRQYPLDLSDKTLIVKWGSNSSNQFTIDPDELIPHPKRELFTYRNKFGNLQLAMFDLDKGIFQIYIQKSGLPKPNQDLNIRIEDRNDAGQTVVLYNETVKIRRP